MRKKLIAMAVALLTTVAANAQFEAGKVYVGVQAQAGYMVSDDLMLLGQTSYERSGNDAVPTKFMVGVGGRYYIEQNGVFLGANCKFLHASGGYDDIMPGVEVGYAFFLSRTVTVEPAIYYDQSFKKHSDFSTIGLRLGVGIYLFKE